MSKKWKIRLAKYGGCALFVGVMAWTYIALRDFAGAALVDQYRYLCDAFTIPGTLLLMVGCLISLSNEGALDGLGYAVSFGIGMIIPGRGARAQEKYADYVDRRRSKRLRGYGFLYISGAVTMAVALVFLGLFYSVFE